MQGREGRLLWLDRTLCDAHPNDVNEEQQAHVLNPEFLVTALLWHFCLAPWMMPSSASPLADSYQVWCHSRDTRKETPCLQIKFSISLKAPSIISLKVQSVCEVSYVHIQPPRFRPSPPAFSLLQTKQLNTVMLNYITFYSLWIIDMWSSFIHWDYTDGSNIGQITLPFVSLLLWNGLDAKEQNWIQCWGPLAEIKGGWW